MSQQAFMATKLKLSIVTIHLEDFHGLDETYHSIAKLLAENQLVEWIVVDGGSIPSDPTDSAIIKKTAKVANTFIFEPDNGIYDAMNKGAKLATGDYLLFINSGDLIHPDLNCSLLKSAMENKPDMIWGQCVEEYNSGALVKVKTRNPRWAWYSMPVHHSATIYKRAVLEHPVFNLKYKIGGDYDLLLKLLSETATVTELKSPISIFRHGGISGSQWKQAFIEEETLRSEYFGFGQIKNKFITSFKYLNRQFAKSAALRRFWRKWI